MSLPTSDDLCFQFVQGPGEICVVIPGGFNLCVQGDIEWDDVASVTKTIMGQINTALTPLGPFFTIFDVLIAVFDCIKAVKEAFGPPPNPAKLVQCIQNLQEAIDKLLTLHPAISIPKTVKSVLNVVVLFLSGVRAEMSQLINFQNDIIAAQTRASDLGNLELQAAAVCASDQISVELNSLNESIKPLARLLSIINVLLDLAGLPCIQVPLDPMSSVGDDVLDLIDAAILFISVVRDAIPSVDIPLPAIPLSSDPC